MVNLKVLEPISMAATRLVTCASSFGGNRLSG
jgi:hypothetical protein